ncbi:site-specific integrase [Bacillus sp. Bva_UNVM-123]|uniref:site-specific integrase n=1 Tax=Bacillus sp. Bva_UNVM-123 TaxID=2829798 RepID=UPI00391F261D
MKGSIFKRGKIYAVRYDIGVGGKREQKYKGGFKTKKDAQEYLNKALCEINDGTYVKQNNVLFSTYIEEWFNNSYKMSVAETTAETRWFYIEKHVIPYFGKTPLQMITTKKLDEFYNQKIELGLSAKTVREFHNLMRRAFGQAIKWSLIKINPALDATPPKIEVKEINLWTIEQTKQFLKLLGSQNIDPIFELIIFTGMRRGEALGLKWEDIDFQKGKIRVVRSLAKTIEKGLFLKDVKTQSSKRQISISAYLLNKLLQHKEEQSNHKKNFKETYNDQGMVFSTFEGGFKDPRNLLRDFNRLINQSGLPKITIHDLRHLHATQLMINGINPKVVQERLGHSRVAVTLDLYSHVNEDLQIEAAIRFENEFFKDSSIER